VIVGFTNAAALIIGLSQLSKVVGVPFPRSDSYLADLGRVLQQIPEVHWATLAFAVGAWLLIAGLRRASPAVPGVLVAVVVATLVSALIGYEQKVTLPVAQVRDAPTLQVIQDYAQAQEGIARMTDQIAEINQRAQTLEQEGGSEARAQAIALRAQVPPINHALATLKQENNDRRVSLHAMTLEGALAPDGALMLYRSGSLPTGQSGDGKTWRYDRLNGEEITFSAGGAVVGTIPEGLPTLEIPVVHWDLILALLPAALVMALIGFMEATSISKAIATTTGERVDSSKELIGQGLANIAGSFFGSYTVSGSFSRSAVAARSGAKTGLFAIISALAVVLVLLFFTSYLYHLPQAVLAVIVMMAVFSLIRIPPLVNAWKIDRIGASIGILTFVTTLLMAPAIADGILLGIVLTVLHYLIRTMRPRAEIVSRKVDGTLGGIETHGLTPISEHFVPVRFDGSLNFVNVAYFEDVILEAHADFPQAKTILVIGSGINEIDASGEEKVREVGEHLREVGVTLAFSSLKHQVMQVFRESGLVEELGRDAFFKDKENALLQLAERFQATASATRPPRSSAV
jgi:MFS superfamily sulfate permease-like transporter